jgi:hypothetical protein
MFVSIFTCFFVLFFLSPTLPEILPLPFAKFSGSSEYTLFLWLSQVDQILCHLVVSFIHSKWKHMVRQEVVYLREYRTSVGNQNCPCQVQICGLTYDQEVKWEKWPWSEREKALLLRLC